MAKAYDLKEIIDQHFKKTINKKPVSTGFDCIDACIGGGIWKGFFTILAGDSGNGKTTMMEMMSLKQALAQQQVLVISLEMRKEQILEKYLAKLDQADMKEWRVFNMHEHEIEQKKKEAERLITHVNEYLKIDDAEYTVDGIAKRIESAAKEGYDIVYIDYFQSLIMESDPWAYNQASKMICRTIKKYPETAVVLLSQVTVSKGTHPKAAKLRYANQLLNDTSLEIILYLDNGEDIEELNVFLRKNRFGLRNKELKLPFFGEKGIIGDLDDVSLDQEEDKIEAFESGLHEGFNHQELEASLLEEDEEDATTLLGRRLDELS